MEVSSSSSCFRNLQFFVHMILVHGAMNLQQRSTFTTPTPMHAVPRFEVSL
jgi:hypothetical protein